MIYSTAYSVYGCKSTCRVGRNHVRHILLSRFTLSRWKAIRFRTAFVIPTVKSWTPTFPLTELIIARECIVCTLFTFAHSEVKVCCDSLYMPRSACGCFMLVFPHGMFWQMVAIVKARVALQTLIRCTGSFWILSLLNHVEPYGRNCRTGTFEMSFNS